MTWRHRFDRILPWLSVLIVTLAICVIYHLLRHQSLAEIGRNMVALPHVTIGWAVALTVTSYGLLSLYDVLAFRHLQHDMKIRRILPVSFMAYALSNSIGLGGVAGSSVRLRLYRHWGLTTFDVVRVIFFCSVSFWLGFAALAGVIFIVHPPQIVSPVPIDHLWLNLIGLILFGLTLGYLRLTWSSDRVWRVSDHLSLNFPRFDLALGQIGIASLDWALLALVLYVLLPAQMDLAYIDFLALFLAAQVIALASHVPGGVGVLEAMLVVLLPPERVPTATLIASLMAFRVIYYFLPLILGLLLLLIHEGWVRFSGSSIGKIKSNGR